MMVPPHCLAAWRILRSAARVGLALLLLVLLAIAGGGGTIVVGFAILALAAAVYAEVLQAIRSVE